MPRSGRIRRLLAVGAGAWLLLSIAAVTCLRFAPPRFTAYMACAKVAALASRQPLEVRFRWVDWPGLSPAAALAVVAAEDQRFLGHHGFDFRALRAALEDGRHGRGLRGASTISQQTARNLFLWPGRSWIRKAFEACFTVLLEAILPKRRILELYLNIAEFGPGVYGLEAATQTFFRKPAARLTRGEAALLAAVLPNPRRLRVDRPSPYMRARAARILGQAERVAASGLLKRL